MKPNILILYNFILHYRIPFFNVLAQNYNISVLHSGKKSKGPDDMFEEIIVPVKKIGPFYLQKGVLEEVNNSKYDIIIALFDVRWLNTLRSIHNHNKKAKYILWGAWITNNYIADKVRLFYTNIACANVFYTNEALQDFVQKGIDPRNLYVGNNTFDVGERIRSFENPEKKSILFVGSLDERKQNDILLRSFSEILEKIPSDITLTIIGDGIQKEILEALSNELQLGKRVDFVGKLTDTRVLMDYYKKAIVSVSFGQAGLSVLQSLGYGVPFLTKENAISGGEKSNIRNEYNGILCKDDKDSLSENLVRLCNYPEYAKTLGKNAFDYYTKYCSMENMVQGFRDAIEGTRLAVVDKN
jgi:glycosyltransferase involved in cell wall biosynthesis